jgi:hypothetical protein
MNRADDHILIRKVLEVHFPRRASTASARYELALVEALQAEDEEPSDTMDCTCPACLADPAWGDWIHKVAERVELGAASPALIAAFAGDIRWGFGRSRDLQVRADEPQYTFNLTPHRYAHRLATWRACRQLGCDDTCAVAPYREPLGSRTAQ